MPNRILSPITEIDFDGIKSNLKQYLSTTTEFSDYDYEGAGINILLDLLAYNTHYTAMYANMLAAESFIDSAILRKSVVSLAKNLGYIPNSDAAATATVSLTFGTTAGVPNSLPVGTEFTATKDGTQYTFTTIEAFEINKSSQPYRCNNVEVHQGRFDSSTIIFDPDSNSTRLELPFSNIDKSTIKVYVLKSSVDLGNADVSWKENTDFISIDSTSKVYFINENYRGNYEISFGDGILGAKPEKGNYIVAIFLKTDGVDGNGISDFTFTGIQGNLFGETVVTAVAASSGGGAKDDEEKIRFAAPRYYQSQDRAVTVQDYQSIILREYSNANQVTVWGGEDNDPPEYGKVFISVLPKNALYLSDAQKNSLIKNIIDKKKIVAVNAEVVDVDFTAVLVDCFATYDGSKTLLTESSIKASILSAMVNYSLGSMYSFGSPFRYSSLSRLIDLSNTSMVSNRITTKLAKKIQPLFGKTNYKLDFAAQLYHPVDGNESIVSTSTFKHRDNFNNVRDCILLDDGYGNIALYAVFGSVRLLINKKIGTIDYSTGKVSLVGFAPTGTGSLPYIQFNVIPDQRYDIVPKRNQILLIDPSLQGGVNLTLQDSSVRRI